MEKTSRIVWEIVTWPYGCHWWNRNCMLFWCSKVLPLFVVELASFNINCMCSVLLTLFRLVIASSNTSIYGFQLSLLYLHFFFPTAWNFRVRYFAHVIQNHPIRRHMYWIQRSDWSILEFYYRKSYWWNVVKQMFNPEEAWHVGVVCKI